MIRDIYLYRNVGSKRMKWKFVIDEDDTILAEGPAEDIPTELGKSYKKKHATEPLRDFKPSNIPTKDQAMDEKGLEALTKRGIKFTKVDGKILIDHMPKKQLTIGEFLAGATCPDDIPNCRALREQMEGEIESHGGKDCPGCTRTQIREKYRAILDNMLS